VGIAAAPPGPGVAVGVGTPATVGVRLGVTISVGVKVGVAVTVGGATPPAIQAENAEVVPAGSVEVAVMMVWPAPIAKVSGPKLAFPEPSAEIF